VVSKRRNNSIFGIFILLAVFTLLFSVVAVRFFYLQSMQTSDGKNLLVESQKRHSRTKTLIAQRGAILDRNGSVIADDTVSYLLQAVVSKDASKDTPKNPVHVVNKEKTAKELAKYISLTEGKILEILGTEDVYQVEFGSAGRNISSVVKKEIEKLELPGLIFVPQSKRFYKSGFFASHAIGYVQKNSKNNNKITGMLGIEKEFDDFLTGINGKLEYLADSKNRIYPGVKPKTTAAKAGATVETTIDRKIQTFLEDAMTKVNDEFTPVQMIGIVANPKTGEILAMSQRPTFNLNTKVGLEANWKNLAIEEAYEPGSTFKIFTLAAAVNEGVFDPNEPYASGQYKVGDDTIKDHNKTGWGTITYLTGVQRSSNVGFSKLAMEKLGPEKFREYITRFGFENKTGINLLNETTSKILFKYRIEQTTTAFGQGTAVTPIQQIQAATAIGNQGKMMQPYIVSKIADPITKKVLYEKKPTMVGEPITASTASQVLNYLETVVTSEAGTGKPYRIDGYSVAGKTGTAQISDLKNGGYLIGDRNHIFSFLGFAPKEDPEIIVYVAVQQPNLKIGQAGSLPVSRVFNPVVENTLKYLHIKPENIVKAQTISVEDFSGKTCPEVNAYFSGKLFSPIFIGNGEKVIGQSVQKNQTIIQGEKVIFLTDGELKVPNLTGWSLRDVNQLASLMGIKLKSTGNGYVTVQNPVENTVMNKGETLTIELKTPIESRMPVIEENQSATSSSVTKENEKKKTN
jgi:penicillin-binding protein 2B